MARTAVAQRQNLLTRSKDGANVDWLKAGLKAGTPIISNAAIGPDGTMTADQIVEDNSTGFHILYRNTGAVVPVGYYTISASLKEATRRYGGIEIIIGAGLNRYSVLIDLRTGAFLGTSTTGTVVEPSYTITPEANGYYRISITARAVDLGAIYNCIFTSNSATPSYSASFPSYTGDNASGIYATDYQVVAANWRGPKVSTTTTAINTGNLRNISSARSTSSARTAVAQKQNLLKYSEAPDNAAWTTTSATWAANNIANPINGAVTAYKMTEASATAQHRFYSGIAYVSVTIGQTCTASVYVKAGTRNWFYFTQNDAIFAYFNLTTGLNGTVTSGTLTSKALSNGWYRLSWTFQATTAAPNISFGLTSADNTSSGVGNGTGTMYFWGMQLARSNQAGPYIQTTATPVDTGNIRNIVL